MFQMTAKEINEMVSHFVIPSASNLVELTFQDHCLPRLNNEKK